MKTTSCDVGYMCLELYYNRSTQHSVYDDDDEEYDDDDDEEYDDDDDEEYDDDDDEEYDNDANEYDIDCTSFQTTQPSHQAKVLDKFLSVFQSFSKLKNLA